MRISLRWFLVFIPVLILLPGGGLSQGNTLSLTNVAVPVSKEIWKWTAFVHGPREVLDKIECVEYTLHPTFKDPVQKICATADAKYPFGITVSGWGTFDLEAKVQFKDGTSKELVHYLNFDVKPK